MYYFNKNNDSKTHLCNKWEFWKMSYYVKHVKKRETEENKFSYIWKPIFQLQN